MRNAYRLVMAFALLAALSVAGVSGSAAAANAADPPAPTGTPTAQSFTGTPTVGALFRNGLSGDHSCTASVVASPTHNLIITAAHCVSGTAAGYQFAPGYDKGATPYGVWTVLRAYADPSWITSQNSEDDVAVLVIEPQRIGRRVLNIQDVTGGNLVAPAPRAGSTIVDVAYNAGRDDDPIACRTTVYDQDGYPAFNCHGFVGGSSGSPWLTPVPGTRVTLVRGVIGGLHQGGCYEYTSYSSRFGLDVYRLLARAIARSAPDTLPVAGSDGC